jgi:hypothetical protein
MRVPAPKKPSEDTRNRFHQIAQASYLDRCCMGLHNSPGPSHVLWLFVRNREVQRMFQQKPVNFRGKAVKNSRDFMRSRGTTTLLNYGLKR